jgi:cytochrome c oxidase subunit 3
MTTAHPAHEDDHGGGHGHHGSIYVQHHYDDAQHQFDSGKFGTWIFLAQEVLFFSGLFVAYILYRVHHSEIFLYAHKWLEVKWGALNTAVLIFSSLTAAWAVRCAQLRQRKRLLLCLGTTIVCAFGFLSIKYHEYNHKVHEHILFGPYFDPCVSPGGAELLTKTNECPGAKSTVEWSHKQDGSLALEGGNATAGCIEMSTIDQDPHADGLQAECDVEEITRVSKPKTDPKTGRVIGRSWVEQGRRKIADRCPIEPGVEPGITTVEGEPQKATYPCWRPAYQPGVCPDLNSPDKRAHGAASRPQVGILVEYGDETERGENIAIEAKCKPAPKPAAVAAETGTSEQTLELGKKSIHPVHQLTDEEQFELRSMGPPPPHTNMFLTIYFAMTGLHGIHVIFGIFIFIWLFIRAVKDQFSPDYFGPIDYAALYWHIVDIIWIFLFPMLYLIH